MQGSQNCVVVDECCGVRTYSIALKRTDTGEGSVWTSGPLNATTSATAVQLPPSSMDALQHGGTYAVVVVAENGIGMSSIANASLHVDRTPPLTGQVFTDAEFGRYLSCQSDVEAIHLSWAGFVDDESGVAAFEWAVGTRPLTDDLMRFSPISDGASGSVVRTRELRGLVAGMELFHSLRVTNGAGISVVAASPRVPL